MPEISFLIDENVPVQIADFLRQRGHSAQSVGEHFLKSTADSVLVLLAEYEGMVVVTFDRDFRQLVTRAPPGSRTRFSRTAGRLSLTCEEAEALSRIQLHMDAIEFLYEHTQRSGIRFIMQLSATSFTISG